MSSLSESTLLGVPVGEILLLSGFIIVAGVLTGVLAGLFGIGGGGVIVPVLYEMFLRWTYREEVRMQLHRHSSAIIVPTTVRSYLTHRAKGEVIPHVVRIWAAPAVVGVAAGAVAAAFAAWVTLKVAFIVFAALTGMKLLFGPADWKLADDLPGRGPMVAYGFLVGLCSSVVGVSGGTCPTSSHTLWQTHT